MDTPEIQHEKELERLSLRKGVEKFRKKGLSEFHQDFLQKFFEPLTEAIDQRRSEIAASKT
ncbi:MAG: hypothetical protein K2X29_10275, partial [Candidatus Obscuribacterales bacterium]|nr:hypothetical protein [Candidatus Obscuribacterales bacterium]